MSLMLSLSRLDALSDAVSVWTTSRARPPLVKVLRLLPLDARARAACVCRVWRDAAVDPDALASLWFEEGGNRRALSDDILARLCARAGAALREVRLDAHVCGAVTAAGVVAALRQGGCASVQRLVLKRLVLSTHVWQGYKLSAEQAQQLAAACPMLEHSLCCVCCASAEDVADVCASLPGPLTLVAVGLDAARAASQLSARVAELALEECTLDEPCVAALGDALRTNTALMSLHLRGAGVGDFGAALLGEALRTNATLNELDLSYNGIGDVGASLGAASLGEALCANAALTTLKLSRNRFGDAGATSLGEALRANATLKTLALGENNIGDAGAISLGQALRTNATLTTLDLSQNRFGDFGAASLGEALSTNAALKKLDLGNNDIGDAGAVFLVGALCLNATLTKLVLGNNNIGDASAVLLGEALRTNATLIELDLSYNGIGDAGAAALGKALRMNATLDTLRLGGNRIGDEGAAALVLALRSNRLRGLRGNATLFYLVVDGLYFVQF